MHSPMRPVVLVALCFAGCRVYRDDTTGTMRQLVARCLEVSYDEVRPEETLKDLNCDELDFVELVMEIEDGFSVSISDAEIEALGGTGGWEEITVLDLANLVRNKRPELRSAVPPR